MHNSATHADQAERARALDPGASFIVQAPAGSGKTGLLTLRFLTLLARVDWPEEIIAITFTRKAAAEMRHRILEALRNAHVTVETGHWYEEQLRQRAQAALARDHTQAWGLLENPNRLRIRTIDSLCATLTAQMPVLSGLGSQPEIVEDATELYREAAVNTLRQLEHDGPWSSAIEALIRHLDNNLPRLEGMLTRMLARRDQWLRHLYSGSQRRHLEQAMATEVQAAIEKVREGLPQETLIQISTLAEYAAANLAREDTQTRLHACAGLSQYPLSSDPATLPVWKGVAWLLLTDKGEWRKTITVKQGFPPKVPGVWDPAYCRGMKQDMQTLLDQLADDDALKTHLHVLRNLPDAHYDDAQWAILQALFDVLSMALAELRLCFQQRGQVDFIELGLAALTSLGQDEAPTDLALALDYRIRHLLVDEFQDTAFNQYLLLKGLTVGWQENDGRSLFLVGDPMQSIYRFREAEVGLFLRTVQSRRLGQVPLTPLTLTVNFRAQAGIVDWINQRFQHVFPGEVSIADGAVPYTASLSAHPEIPYAVLFHAMVDAPPRAEAERTLELVTQARERGGSIAVLARNRNHLSEIIGLLSEQGLPYQAVEIEQLSHRPVVQDLLSLTIALLHGAERIAWLAVLRAPWCGLTLSDLVQLAGDDHRRPLWSLMQDEIRCAGLSEDGQVRLKRVKVILAKAFEQRGRRPLRRWVEGVWLALGGPACSTHASDLDNAERFFCLLETHDSGGDIVGMDQLRKDVASLYATPAEHRPDSIQLMTLHKAKGLEFDTVIVPMLGRRPRQDERHLLIWMERPRKDGGNDLLLAPIEEAGTDKDPIYNYLRELDKCKQRFEDGRLLYVAATRARLCLHLIGSVKSKGQGEGTCKTKPTELAAPASGSLLSTLWPAVEQEFLSVAKTHAEQTDPEPAPPQPAVIQRLTSAWVLPAPPASLQLPTTAHPPPNTEIDYQWVSGTLRHIGSVVHRYLQMIATQGLEAWDPARIASCHRAMDESLSGLGVASKEIEAASTEVINALTQAISDPRGRWILSLHESAHCEYALSGMIGHQLYNVVIDRTFVDDKGTRWIIDYKTSKHTGSDAEEFLDNEQQRYRLQLERYAQLMQGLESNPICLGLYFPLLHAWREWRLVPVQSSLTAPTPLLRSTDDTEG